MKELALFPLSIFLLPGDFAQLYIFEERYKQLIADCVEHNINFGIPYTHKLNAANIGCEVEVAEIVKRYPGGELDILIKGVDIFQLDKFMYQSENKLHPAGRVTELHAREKPASEQLILKFKEYLQRYNPEQVETLNQGHFGIFEIGRLLKLNHQEKLELVQLPGTEFRQNYLLNYLRFLELLHEQENHQYQNIYLN